MNLEDHFYKETIGQLTMNEKIRRLLSEIDKTCANWVQIINVNARNKLKLKQNIPLRSKKPTLNLNIQLCYKLKTKKMSKNDKKPQMHLIT